MRYPRLFLLLISLFTLAGCGGGGSSGGDPADTTAPSVSFIAPSDDSTTQFPGVIAIRGTASDDTNLASVKISIDGGKATNVTGLESWSYNWDASSASLGAHALLVTAHDAANNASQASINITLSASTNSPGLFNILTPSQNVDEGVGSVTFVVERSGGTQGAVSIDWTTAEKTAQNQVDYTGSNGVFSWADGESGQKQVSIPIIDDTAQEVSESFDFLIQNPQGGTTLRSATNISITINDNDSISIPSQVSKDGVTWSFDSNYVTGQFANGDYYVIDPGTGVNVVAITQPNGGSTDGSMINPSTRSSQGYNQNAPGYDAALNVASSVTTSNPLTIVAGDSLISTIGRPCDGKTCVENAAVLTVLRSQPPAGSFRPAYFGTDKSIKYNKSDMDLSKLRRLINISGMPSLSSTEDSIARPWIDTLGGWTGRQIHPANNMPNYGREIANVIGVAGLMLNADFTDLEKEQLAIYMCQLGIDFYGISTSGSGWSADGGHSSGRKLPIVIAGSILNDNNMLNIGSSVAFGEDQQTFYVSQEDVDLTNGSTWNPDTRHGDPLPYIESDIGTPEWGIRHTEYPTLDNKAWSAIYRTCCTAVAWGGEILAIEAMGLRQAWNHDALFDYMERYMSVDESRRSSWVGIMWDTYHNNMTP